MLDEKKSAMLGDRAAQERITERGGAPESGDNGVVFTPIFKSTVYMHHTCSECGAKLKFDQTPFGGVSFYECESVKYCPSCGGQVIRFLQEPAFETYIDWRPIEKFVDLHLEYKDKVKWLFWCEVSGESRGKIQRLIPFLDLAYGINKIAIEEIKEAERYKPSWQTIQKLKRRFDVGNTRDPILSAEEMEILDAKD